MRFFTLIWLSLLLLCGPAKGAEVRYPSGLLKSFVAEAPPRESRSTEARAIKRFLEKEYSLERSGLEWREVRVIHDSTHTHHLFELYHLGRKVKDQFLNLHYNRSGWLEYATSTLEFAVGGGFAQETSSRQAALEAAIRREVGGPDGVIDGTLSIDPVIWMSPRGDSRPAFEVQLVRFHPTRHRHYIVDEADFHLLEEKAIARFLDVPNHTFVPSPFPNGSPVKCADGSSNPCAVTLPGLNDATALKSPFLHVMREQLAQDASGSISQQDIDPTHDYSQDAAFLQHQDPGTSGAAGYNYTCFSASSTGCPIQSFDGVDVYFHVNSYRLKVKAYYDQLGIQEAFPYDPLTVLVNAQSVVLKDSSGNPIVNNNAAYVPAPCLPNAPRCLIFLPPETINSTLCGNNRPFYDLARESVVAVHEFQHYVTDTVTHMISSSVAGVPSVGDALHEGYSDYFGASHVSAETGREVTKVGEYAFQQCPSIIRDLSVLRVYTNNGSDTDPHASGLTWASGMWKLRNEFQPSPQTMDLIALKSQFFLSERPGFIEAIEALVKADQAINQGAHVARIRELFYDELKFTGGVQSGIFQNTGDHLVAMGFQSCSAVHRRDNRPPVGVWFLFAWLFASMAIGRALRRKSL